MHEETARSNCVAEKPWCMGNCFWPSLRGCQPSSIEERDKCSGLGGPEPEWFGIFRRGFAQGQSLESLYVREFARSRGPESLHSGELILTTPRGLKTTRSSRQCKWSRDARSQKLIAALLKPSGAVRIRYPRSRLSWPRIAVR